MNSFMLVLSPLLLYSLLCAFPIGNCPPASNTANLVARMDFGANTASNCCRWETEWGRNTGVGPSSNTSTLGCCFLCSPFPHVWDKPGALFYLITGEIQVISIDQPYLGSLEDRSSSSSSFPHYAQKYTQENHICTLAINKEMPSFRKIGKLC